MGLPSPRLCHAYIHIHILFTYNGTDILLHREEWEACRFCLHYFWFICFIHHHLQKNPLHMCRAHPAISPISQKPTAPFHFGRGRETDPSYSSTETHPSLSPCPLPLTWERTQICYGSLEISLWLRIRGRPIRWKSPQPCCFVYLLQSLRKTQPSQEWQRLSECRVTNLPNGKGECYSGATAVPSPLPPPTRDCTRQPNCSIQFRPLTLHLFFWPKLKKQWKISQHLCQSRQKKYLYHTESTV